MRTSRAVLVTLAIAASLVAGCTKDEPSTGPSAIGTAPPGSSAEMSSTSTPTSSRAPGTSSTTASAQPPSSALPPAALGSENATDPAGSGCAPDSQYELPDGQWFGRLEPIGADSPAYGLDLACLYTGDAAVAAAAADNPDDPSGAAGMVENDYYITNTSANLYSLPFAAGDAFTAYLLTQPGSADYGPPIVGFDEAVPLIESYGYPFFTWVVVEGGEVVLLQQQFFP